MSSKSSKGGLVKILTSLIFELQTSLRGQNGVEFYQQSTGHFGFYPGPLIGRNSQWEAENPNFLVIWATDKFERSKWGRILPGFILDLEGLFHKVSTWSFIWVENFPPFLYIIVVFDKDVHLTLRFFIKTINFNSFRSSFKSHDIHFKSNEHGPSCSILINVY